MDDARLKKKFELAVEHANSNTGGPSLDTTTQLMFYGLYNQALKGKCAEKQPSKLNFVKYAKWQAWNELGDMSSKKAMKLYLKEMKKADPDWKEAMKNAKMIKFRSRL